MSAPASAQHASGRAHEPGLPMGWVVALILLPLLVGAAAWLAGPPLYRLWCTKTGTSLNANDPEVAAMLGAHTGRFVKVWFGSRVDDGLPVDFGPVEPSAMVEVGMDGRATYRITNRSDRTVRIRPVHYIAPINASTAFGMKVCFCFNDITLAPHESASYPVVFVFAPRLDERIRTVSICYTLFSRDGGEDDLQLNRRIERTVKDRGFIVSPRQAPTGQPDSPATHGSATSARVGTP